MQTDPTTAFVPTAAPLVYCIVVNWNGWPDTLACLASLMQQDYPALRVILVDNGSTNDSVDRIRSAFPHIAVLETGKNLGFPSASNVGIRHAYKEGADFVWLLNNDTIAPPDTCSKLVARAIASPAAGLIGTVLYRMDDPTAVQAWGGGNINLWLAYTSHFLAPSPLRPHTYFTFASVLISRKVLSNVGILYEGFFMYWDDVDLALRVTQAGYTLVMAEDTAVLHKEGGSSEPRSPVIDRYAIASGLHFLRRHAPLPPLSIVLYLSSRLAMRLLRREWKHVRALFLAVADDRVQRRNVYRDTL